MVHEGGQETNDMRSKQLGAEGEWLHSKLHSRNGRRAIALVMTRNDTKVARGSLWCSK